MFNHSLGDGLYQRWPMLWVLQLSGCFRGDYDGKEGIWTLTVLTERHSRWHLCCSSLVGLGVVPCMDVLLLLIMMICSLVPSHPGTGVHIVSFRGFPTFV